MDKKEVLMYSSPTCGYCGRIKKELKEKGIQYEERDYKEYAEDWELVKSVTRSAVFPTFVIGQDYIVPGRDYSDPEQAISIIQYYQSSLQRENNIDDVVELLKNTIHMVKILGDKIVQIEGHLKATNKDDKEYLRQQIIAQQLLKNKENKLA